MQYGKTALEAVMKSIAGHESSLVPPPVDYKGNFFADARKALVGVGIIYYNEKWGGFASLDKGKDSRCFIERKDYIKPISVFKMRKGCMGLPISVKVSGGSVRYLRSNVHYKYYTTVELLYEIWNCLYMTLTS